MSEHACGAQAPLRPNIFCFVADQMRADSLHHLGNQASITPNLDRIPAEDGVSFENAYCQNPVCVPSRCSFLTGLYPHTTGHRTMHYLQRHEDEPNLLRTMKDAGYEVIWIGRNDVIPGDCDKTPYCDEYYDGARAYDTKADPRPFAPAGKKPPVPTDEEMESDDFYSFYIGRLPDSEGYGKTDWNCVDAALRYIERRSEQGSDKPFFVYCTISFPHPPYACEDPWYSSIDRAALPPRRPSVAELEGKASMLYGINAKQRLNGWSEERFDELRATYLAMVSRFDHQYGMIVDKLRECGLYDNTSIFVWSDHGDYTGDYAISEKVQNCFEDPVSNVPLLVKPARGIACEPRVTGALAELTDISATVCAMSGVELPWVSFGSSLLPVLAGADEHRDCVICEGGRVHGETQAMESGHGPASPYWPRLSTQESEGPEHTKACMIRMGNLKYTMRLYERDELYDLERDPMELENRIDDPAYAKQLAEMRMRLLRLYMETGDYVPQGRDKR